MELLSSARSIDLSDRRTGKWALNRIRTAAIVAPLLLAVAGIGALDSGAEVPLATTDAAAAGVGRSGDVIFVEYDAISRQGSLWFASTSGRSPSQVVSKDGFVFSRVAASPDGTRAATAAGVSGDQLGLWTVDLTSSAMDELVSGDQGSVTSVSWSPDGTRLAYSQRVLDGSTVFVLNVETGARSVAASPRSLSVDGLSECDGAGRGSIEVADWSPDSARLALSATATCAEQNFGDVVVVNADGSSLRKISSGVREERAPAWSPDGSEVAYETAGRLRDS